MTVLSALSLAPVVADGPAPPLDLAAQVTGDGSTALTLDATMQSLVDYVRPRGAVQLTMPFRVYIDDVLQDPSRRLPGMTVTETLKGPTFQWTMPRRSDYPAPFVEPLGQPAAYYGAPPGKARIDIDLPVVTPTGVVAIRLVTGGVVENSPATIGEKGTRTLNGIGARGRHDHALATLTFAPGHGLARNDVVRRVLVAAGVPASRIGVGVGGRRCYKGVQLVDRQALSFCDEYLQPAISELAEGRDGRFSVASKIPPSSERPADWTFREVDLVKAGLSESSAQDGPTCVRVTGTKQITRDDTGLTTETIVETAWSFTPPRRAAWRQSSGGTLSAVTSGTQTPPTELGWIFSRVTKQTVRQGDTLILERTTTEGRYNPLVYRYGLATDGSTASYNGAAFIYEADAVADDGNLTYAFVEERFGATAQETIRYEYDERGMQIGRTRDLSQYLLRYRSVQDRADSSTGWDSASWKTGLKVLGNGDGVWEDEGFAGTFTEVYVPGAAGSVPGPKPITGGYNDGRRPVKLHPNLGLRSGYVEREATVYDCTDDGYRTRDTVTLTQYAKRPGVTERYNGGEESRDAVILLLDVSTKATVYADNKDGSHSWIETTTDMIGGQGPVTRTGNGTGGLPAAEQSLDLVDPNWLLTHSEDDLLYAKAASRFESQPIKSRRCATALASVRESWEATLSSEWGEDTDELDAEADYEIRRGCVGEIQFELAACNPLVRPRQVAHLSLPSEGFEGDVWVTEVANVEGERSTRTRISGEQWFA